MNRPIRTDVVVLCTDAKYFLTCAFLIEHLVRQPGAERFDVALVHQAVPVAQLARLAERAGHSFVAVPFDGSVEGLPIGPAGSHFSSAAYMKLHVARLLPSQYTRILYLDSDIYIERPGMTTLFDLDLGGAAFAAGLGGVAQEVLCPEVVTASPSARASRRAEIAHKEGLGLAPGDPYLNAGVLLIDRRRWMQLDISGRALEFAQSHPERCTVADESAINAVSIGRWAKLSPRWNFVSAFVLAGLHQPVKPVFRHFAGGEKPWNSVTWGRHYKRAYDTWLASSGWQGTFPERAGDPAKAVHRRPKASWLQRKLRRLQGGPPRPGTAPVDVVTEEVVRDIGIERHTAFRHAALAVVAFNRFIDLSEPERRALLDEIVEPVLSRGNIQIGVGTSSPSAARPS